MARPPRATTRECPSVFGVFLAWQALSWRCGGRRVGLAWTAGTAELGPPRVHRIVITGGPCAGKTTAMAKLSLRLSNMGFDVFVVPELATLTITGGASPGSYTKEQHVNWETALLRAQMHLEDTFTEIAENCSLTEGRHAVLLCDRGTMDVLAYIGKDTFDEVLEDNGWTVPQLRDQRYEAVVHLVTAAIGAEDFYTLENNKARMESRDEAISLDGKLSRAWVGHNSLHIIENAGGFEEKMRRATTAVCNSLGVPGPRTTQGWRTGGLSFMRLAPSRGFVSREIETSRANHVQTCSKTEEER